MVAGFDGTVCVWAKETRLGAILSLDREVIPKKKRALSLESYEAGRSETGFSSTGHAADAWPIPFALTCT